MWSTPSSTARRNTRRASSRSRGGPMTPGPGSCMAPKPTRRTVRSARGKVSVIPSTLGVGVRSNARPPAPSDAPTFDTRLRTTVAIAITTCEITLSNNGFRRIQAESGRTSSFASRAVRRTHNVSHPLRARHDADPLFGKTRLRSVTQIGCNGLFACPATGPKHTFAYFDDVGHHDDGLDDLGCRHGFRVGLDPGGDQAGDVGRRPARDLGGRHEVAVVPGRGARRAGSVSRAPRPREPRALSAGCRTHGGRWPGRH